MSIAGLIAGLESRGIILSLAGEEIRYRSPKDALTGADREALKAQRGAILDYLKTRAAARALKAAGAMPGPLKPSVAQDMWWRFAGAPDEGKPVALLRFQPYQSRPTFQLQRLELGDGTLLISGRSLDATPVASLTPNPAEAE